jgi:hypothetical protein
VEERRFSAAKSAPLQKRGLEKGRSSNGIVEILEIRKLRF